MSAPPEAPPAPAAAPAPRVDPHATPEAATRLRRARTADRAASRLIRVGGVGVLLAVVAIFVFIGGEALPLLQGADVDARAEALVAAPPAAKILAVASDEYRARIAAVNAAGELLVIDAASGAVGRREAVFEKMLPVTAAVEVRPDAQFFFTGSADGRLVVVRAGSRISFDEDGRRTVDLELEKSEPLAVHEDGRAITAVAGVVMEEDKAFVACASEDSVTLARFKLPGGRARVTKLDPRNVFGSGARVRCLAVALMTDVFRVYAGLSDGRVVRWDADWTDDPRLHEAIDAANSPITSLAVVLGGETLVTGAEDGSVATWFGVRASTNAVNWDLTRIRTFPRLEGGVSLMAPSARRKGFAVLGADGGGRIDYATTGTTRGELPPGGAAPTAVSFTPRNDGLVVAGADGRIRGIDYADPHPDSGVRALFGRLWYEGGTEPEHKWQSSGGTDDFEPKLSVWVLVFGTLKGVLYSLLFSVPVALLAAVYTALFLPSRIKAVVKPVLEVMAALPSVVVGLLAALWLSPLVERNLTSTFAIFPAFVVCFSALVIAWCALPRHVRNRLTQGPGVLVLCTFAVVLSVVIAAASGPAIESGLFGGDVKAWFRDNAGMRYDPRNAMVVGFAMGFAVIPVIFTIAEDAISNVPKSLWAASEALGASRWQTTIRVVLPAATPGIFAALMLGFGRAIGETMIVLMATGNTPILDLSPFNGMRTISACIAVEIPEAPHGETLYRVLFLAGALLFLFTFLCNTVAEIVGSRLRKKYGRAG